MRMIFQYGPRQLIRCKQVSEHSPGEHYYKILALITEQNLYKLIYWLLCRCNLLVQTKTNNKYLENVVLNVVKGYIFIWNKSVLLLFHHCIANPFMNSWESLLLAKYCNQYRTFVLYTSICTLFKNARRLVNRFYIKKVPCGILCKFDSFPIICILYRIFIRVLHLTHICDKTVWKAKYYITFRKYLRSTTNAMPLKFFIAAYYSLPLSTLLKPRKWIT